MVACAAVLALALGALAGGAVAAGVGQCNPAKPGCMAPSASPMKCARGHCDAAKDGWACCAGKGGRVGGSPDYPFMCAVKVPFGSYGATPDQTAVLVYGTDGLLESFSGPNPCLPTATSDAPYNTVCEYPIKHTPEECGGALGGLQTGIFACGHAGQCDPMKAGCKAPMTDVHPILCADGETCDAEADGWACCAARGGRTGASPHYPFMCAVKVPFGSYGATPDQTAVLVYGTDGLLEGFSGPNPCAEGSAAYDTVCEFPIKATTEECGGALGGLSHGVLGCGYKSTNTMSCRQVKHLYRHGQCCSDPDHEVTV